MTRLAQVAWFEYRRHVATRRFLAVTLGVPLLVAVVAAVVLAAVRAGSSGEDLKWGVVGGEAPWSGAVRYGDSDVARQALESGEIAGYVLVAADGGSDVVSRSPMPLEIADALRSASLQGTLAAAPADVRRLLEHPAELRYISLGTEDEAASGPGLGFALLLALVIPFVFIMAVMFATNFLIVAITEEKVNRVVEILLTSVSPRDLLAGKVVGLGALSLTQSAVWLAALVLMAAALIEVPAGNLWEIVAWQGLSLSAVYFVLGYLLYAALMIGIGVAVGQPREAQQLAGFLSFVLVLPFLLVALILVEPDGTVATVLSVAPPTSPVAMPMRLVLSAAPGPQVALSLLLLVVTVWMVVAGVARVFRASVLLYGQRLSLRGVAKALRA